MKYVFNPPQKYKHNRWQHANVCKKCNNIRMLVRPTRDGKWSLEWGKVDWDDPCPACGAYNPRTGGRTNIWYTNQVRLISHPWSLFNPFSWFATPKWEVWREKTDLEKIAEAGSPE